jgi:HPt (histidine-containing phosphotransfer) domain-containing protein
MEGKKQEMLVNDDTTLMFLGDVLSYLIKSSFDMEEEFIAKEKQPSAALTVFEHPSVQEFSMIEEENVFFEKARNIQNLDVEKGILLIGGEKKRYTELLRITIKVISEEILKMRNFYSSDLPAFAIEVHGIKSALFNIGAEALGDEAKQLEFAAKSDDTVYCKESYPLFEEKLRVFSRNLAALFPQQERNSRTGDRTELVDALEKAKDACEKFDVAAANSLLAPFINCKWEDDTIQKNLGVILMDMENLEYDGLTEKISRLINLLRDQRQ